MTLRKHKRGKIVRAESVFIGAWFPKAVAQAMDGVVDAEDTDRSKFLRRAVEAKLQSTEAAAK